MQFSSKCVATKLVQHYYTSFFLMFTTDSNLSYCKWRNITQRQRKPLHSRTCYHLMQQCFTKHVQLRAVVANDFHRCWCLFREYLKRNNKEPNQQLQLVFSSHFAACPNATFSSNAKVPHLLLPRLLASPLSCMAFIFRLL